MITPRRVTLRLLQTPESLDQRPRLAATLSPLLTTGEFDGLRGALEWISQSGYRGVQLSAIEPGLRPRELSLSARRDLAATLRRLELTCAGIDLFLPPSHLTDPQHVSRALDAIEAALEFAAVLGRAGVTIPLGVEEPCEIRAAIAATASRLGVSVHLPVLHAKEASGLVAPFQASVDCASVLGAGVAPEELVGILGSRLGSVRVVDLWRSGLRGAILEPRESRLDALALRIALETSGFRQLAVVDARQWTTPRRGLEQVLERWSALVPS